MDEGGGGGGGNGDCFIALVCQMGNNMIRLCQRNLIDSIHSIYPVFPPCRVRCSTETSQRRCVVRIRSHVVIHNWSVHNKSFRGEFRTRGQRIQGL